MQLFLIYEAVGTVPWKTIPWTTTSTVSHKQVSTLVVTHHQLSTNSTQIGHVVHQLHKALPRTNTSFNVMRGLLLQLMHTNSKKYLYISQLLEYPCIPFNLYNSWTFSHLSHHFPSTFHPQNSSWNSFYLLVAHGNLVSAELHRFMCVYMNSNRLKSIFVSGTQQYASPSSWFRFTISLVVGIRSFHSKTCSFRRFLKLEHP